MFPRVWVRWEGQCLRETAHRHKEFDVASNSDNLFFIKLRQLCANPLDFSVILAYHLPGLHTLVRLRRYNGKHHHTNHLEHQRFYGFHIHTATQRYQSAGFRADHFAEMTNRYWDLESAIRCLLADCGFKSPLEESPLFRQKP
jgi:hypothetical protein